MFQQYLSSNKRWSWSTLCCQKKSHVISQSMKWVRKLESSQFSLLRLNLGPSLMFLRMTRFVISVTWWVSLNAWSVLCAVDSCGRWIQQSVSYLSWMNSLSGCWKLNVQIWLVWRFWSFWYEALLNVLVGRSCTSFFLSLCSFSLLTSCSNVPRQKQFTVTKLGFITASSLKKCSPACSDCTTNIQHCTTFACFFVICAQYCSPLLSSSKLQIPSICEQRLSASQLLQQHYYLD